MPDDPPGSAAPKPAADRPRRSGGPKRPPRPERPGPADGPAANGPARAVAPGFGGAVKIKAPPAQASAPSVVREAEPETDTTAVPELATLPGRTPPPTPSSDVTDVRASVASASATATPSTGGRAIRRGRRVKRVVRRIDLWSVLKLSIVVYTCIYVATLGTLAALWGLLYSSGSIDRLQSFLADVGLENFTFYGDQMFRACAAIGAVAVLAGTVITVLATALVNIISEMTGGIRLVVIEEDVEPRR